MAAIDFAKFKKIASDDKVTTLKHPAGHMVHIAHNVLHPKLKAELDKIPMHKQNAIKEFKDGGDVANDMPDNQDQGAQDNQNDNTAPAKAPQGTPVVINVGGAQPQPPAPAPVVQPKPPQPQQNQPAIAPVPVPMDQQDENQPDNVEAVSETPGGSSLGAPGNGTPPIVPAGIPSTPEASNNTQSPSESAAPEAAVVENPKEQVKQELNNEAMAFQHDLENGHITPETYSDLFAKKSTLGKISSIFGMMLSGMGSGLTHQPNALLQIMQNEINNDLEAQKQSKGNAQNFLRLNQQNKLNEAQTNLTQAEADTKSYALAQSQMLQSSFHDLVQNVNKMPEGAQKEAAKQQLGMIYTRVADRINNINDQAAGASQYYNTLFGKQGSAGASQEQGFQKQMSGMRMLGPQGEARAKDMEEKHFPGLPGQASVPLTSGDRDSINSGIDFDQKLHRFIGWTKNHSGDLSPSDMKAGQALAAELQGAYRQATHGGVYKEGEQNFISKLIDSKPTKFFNEIRVLPQLNAIAGENHARVNQLVQSKGFPGYPGVQQNIPAPKAPGQAAADQPQYKMVGGVKYMRGPNGEAIKVQ